MSVYWRRCSGHTILTTQSRALTFRKCVDVWVTFKNDPNNHRRDTQKPAENYISLADTNLLICPLLHRDNRAFILILKLQYLFTIFNVPTCDGFGAGSAALGEQLRETVRAVRHVLAGGEPGAEE